MIIRSADKESIVNFENLSLIQIEQSDNGYTVMAYDTGSSVHVCLGSYDSKEKAMRVIDMIASMAMPIVQLQPDEDPEED